MDYKGLFKRLQCSVLVIFDDDCIQGKPNKRHIVHDFVLMEHDDQHELVSILKTENQELAVLLESIACKTDAFFNRISWRDDVIIDDFESVFPLAQEILDKEAFEEYKEKYVSLDEQELIDNYMVFSKYGVGIQVPSCYQTMISQYEANNGRHGKMRIFGDFTSETKVAFMREIEAINADKTMICIVDNLLADGEKAKEIIESISESGENANNIVGTIFTSREEIERIDEGMCFVCTKKDTPEILLMNLVRSAYHHFLAKLQDEVERNIEGAFRKAKENKYIANYLSKRALSEGLSDLSVIQNWIRLMYEVQTAKSNATKKLICLSNIVNELEDTEDERYGDDLLDELNTWEAFDYSINDYHLPPMPGDVFMTEDNKLFILIGQDCDMIVGDGRERKNVVSELLPVVGCSHMHEMKIKNDLEYVWLSNFHHPIDGLVCLKIDYKKRIFIESRILDICMYDNEGNSELDLDNQISEDTEEMLQSYLVSYYYELQKYFERILCMKEKCGEELSYVLNQSKYLISIDRLTKIDNRIWYPLRRICRLKDTYVFYLYKLYLEYRGRQPFDTINYAASANRSITFLYLGKEIQLGIKVKMGHYQYKAKDEDLTWYVPRDEMYKLIKSFSIGEKLESDESYIVLTARRTEIPLKSGHAFIINKKKDNKAEIELKK